MVNIGDIVYGRDIGRVHDAKHRYIWAECPNCHYQRWVHPQRNADENPYRICRLCNSKLSRNHPPPTEEHKKRLSLRMTGSNSPFWKGGRFITKQGYMLVLLPKDNFFAPMANQNGYVCEHRLVMAKYLGRCLHTWEVIHHKDGNKLNNDLNNLAITDISIHNGTTAIIKQNKRLRLENIHLKAILKENHIAIPRTSLDLALATNQGRGQP